MWVLWTSHGGKGSQLKKLKLLFRKKCLVCYLLSTQRLQLDLCNLSKELGSYVRTTMFY